MGEDDHPREGRPGLQPHGRCALDIQLSCARRLSLSDSRASYDAAGIIAESALALALDDASLPPHAHIGGVLTPATALGSVLISRLEAVGLVQFESQLVRGNEESRKDR